MSEEVFLNRVLPLIFLLVGIGLLVGAAVNVARTRDFLGRAAAAKGEVVALEEEPPTDAQELPTYRPVVTFTVGPTQRKVRFKSMAHSNPPQYKVGDAVPVLYDPDRPDDARIRSFTSLWLLALILGGLGFVFTALGTALLTGYITP